MIQVYRCRVVAGALMGTLLFAGCASAPAGHEGSADAARESECSQSTRDDVSQGRWVRAVGYGIAGVAVGAFRGAAEGVSWGFVRGVNAGQAAWIGAAAGAGLGLIIGMVEGAVKAREVQTVSRSADQACLIDGEPAAAGDKTVLADLESETDISR
jgi:hypothetical protein